MTLEEMLKKKVATDIENGNTDIIYPSLRITVQNTDQIEKDPKCAVDIEVHPIEHAGDSLYFQVRGNQLITRE